MACRLQNIKRSFLCEKDHLHVLVDLRSLFGVLSIVFVKEPFL